MCVCVISNQLAISISTINVISNVLSYRTYLVNGFGEISFSSAATFARGHGSSACAYHHLSWPTSSAMCFNIRRLGACGMR